MPMVEGLKIIGLSVLAACCYGVIHDSVTVRVCVEYFTVFHPWIDWVGESPIILALYWGIAATWWMGLGLGIPLAVFARWGTQPKVTVRDLIRPLVVVLGVMAFASFAFGVEGLLRAESGAIEPPLKWVFAIPSAKHSAFLAVLWAHNAAYAVGFLGGVSLWGWSIRRRRRMKTQFSV